MWGCSVSRFKFPKFDIDILLLPLNLLYPTLKLLVVFVIHIPDKCNCYSQDSLYIYMF